MARSRIGDYLSYGLTGAALGTGAGAVFNSAAHGAQKPVALIGGAGAGAATGALLAYMKHKDSTDPSQLGPGWYVFQRPLKNVPDLGLYTRHSGNLIVLPREQADALLNSSEWKRTSHKNFTGKDGQKLTAFVFDAMPSKSSPLDFIYNNPVDVRFRKATDTFDMPLTDVTKVPLKSNVTLVDAMKRLKQIDNIYAMVGEPEYQPVPKGQPALDKKTPTNCHGITVSVLQDTEDLHNLKEWSPSGLAQVKYTRLDSEPETLQGILDKRYLPEILRAGVSGGVVGGVALGGTGALYGSYETNKHLDPTYEKLKNINTAGTLGLLGALGGSLIGMAGRGAQLAFEKHKAKKELDGLKTAAWKDYAVHGLGGAAVGTAAGALGNLALGRDLLDHRLLLGGMGVGTAAGLFSGHVRSKEREQNEKSDLTVKESYALGPDGKPLKIEGKYVPRYGTYVVVRPLDYGLVPKDVANTTPMYANNAGHAFKVTFTKDPIKTQHDLEQGGNVIFESVKYTTKDPKHPIYAFYHELSNDASPRDDGVKYMSRATINDEWVTPEKLSEYSLAGSTGHYQGNHNQIVEDIFNPREGSSDSQYGRIFALQYDDDVADDIARERAYNRIFAINQRFLKNGGELGPYTMVETPWGKWSGSTNNCLTFLVYLARALERKKLLDMSKTRHLIPNYLGVAFSANMNNRDAYNKVFGDFD